MDEAPDDQHLPAMRIGDREREAVIRGLERAMVKGHLTFDEMEDRMGLAYRAKTALDLEALTADLPEVELPQQPAPARQLGSTQFNLIGSIRRGGWIAVPAELRAISVVGDVTLDLSSATLPPEGVSLTVASVVGDVTVVVADGTPVHIGTISVLGDRHEAVGPAMHGTPPVHIRGLSLVGDIKVYTLSMVPEGRLRAWWTSVRQRALGRTNGSGSDDTA